MILIRNPFSKTMFAATVLFAASGVFAQNTEVGSNSTNRQTVRTISASSNVIAPETNAPRVESLNLTRVGVQTAQPLPLSLNDAIRKALEANNTIEISRGDVRFSETIVNGNRGVYDPVFSVTPTFTRNSTTHDPSTGSSVTRDFRVNSSLSQFIGPGGGNYQVYFNNLRTENAFAQAQTNAGALSGTSALYSSALGVQYNQPLLRNFGIDSRRRILRVSKKQLQQSDTDFRTQVITTINLVQRTYWDLVAALRDQQNQVASVNLARENLRQIDARIAAGAAAPLERAEVATELANREAELLLGTQQVSITENSLKQQLIRDPLAAEWSQSYVPTEAPTVDPAIVNMDAAMKDALDNRFELKRLKLQTEINDIDIKYFKNQTKPQVDFNSNFSLQGLSRSGSPQAITTNLFTSQGDLLLFNSINQVRGALTPALPPIVNTQFTVPASPGFLFGGFNQSFANMFRSDAPNFTVGVTISFPFRNRTAKANLAGAKIQQDQLAAQTRAQEEVVVVDVRNAVQAVETARQRTVATRTARENAEIQLAGERKLYDAGRSTTFLLFQRENALTSAQDAEVRALTDYKKAVADLQRATATTFRENSIDVVSPVTIK